MAIDANKTVATEILVWDIPTRLFHWSVVILVFVSWLSADQGYMSVHLYSGLTLLALLLFRLFWGLLGSTTARFVDFLHPPRRVIAYLKSMRDDPLHFAGHNPAGGLMVFAMIGILIAQVVTGLFSNDGVRFNAPLSLLISSDASTRITEIHALIFDGILILVWCHVVAVGFYLFVKHHNLVRAMVTGRKPADHVPEPQRLKFSPLLLALILFLVSAGIAAWVLTQAASFFS